MKFKQPDDRHDNSTERTITRTWNLGEESYDGDVPYGYQNADTLRNVRVVTSGILQTRFQKGYGGNGGKFYLSWGFRRRLIADDGSGDEVLLRRYRDAWQATGIRMEISDPHLVAANGQVGKRYSKRRMADADYYLWAQWQASVLADKQAEVFTAAWETLRGRTMTYGDVGEMPILTSDWWEDLKNPDGSFVLWVSSVSSPDPELAEALEKFNEYKSDLEKAAEKWGVSTKGYKPPTREDMLYKEERYRNRLGGY